jgi:hypothetical protein
MRVAKEKVDRKKHGRNRQQMRTFYVPLFCGINLSLANSYCSDEKKNKDPLCSRNGCERIPGPVFGVVGVSNRMTANSYTYRAISHGLMQRPRHCPYPHRVTTADASMLKGIF